MKMGEDHHGLIKKLSNTARGFDVIRVIVNRLTKSVHFIDIQERSSVKKLAHIYILEVVALHGVPTSVISDRDVSFYSWFLEEVPL